MGLLADEASVAQRILDHIANRSTDTGDAWREPVENYRREDRFLAEVEMMHRRPTPFCPSAALAAPGDYLARDAAGTPIVAVRGPDGVVRAFRNACRHRGMQVADGSGCAKALVCPYHGWTYRLDGELRHVPHQDGFPDLDPASRGLVAVATVERHGLVFVTQDGAAQPDGAVDELAGLIAGDQALLAAGAHEEPTNWKILVETFLEGYHIRSTHRTTFYPVQFDNLNVVERFGDNSRVTFPFRAIERLAGDPPAPGSLRPGSLDRKVTFVYHLFPNVVVATFPDRRMMIVLEPLAPDRTAVVTYVLSDRRPTGGGAGGSGGSVGGGPNQGAEPGQGRADPADAGAFLAAGATEDFAIARGIQHGLASGANRHLEFGRFESAIGHFHRCLDEALGATRGEAVHVRAAERGLRA